MGRVPAGLTSSTLAAIAAIHIAWGRGSSVPFASREELADAVIGSQAVPSPNACYVVAAALFVASALVGDVPVGPRRLRRLGRVVVGGTLAVRGFAGLCGRTDILSPGSTSARFRRLDRQIYSPLCVALAWGAIAR
jgi:uncharacterized protein DUF3995